MEMSLATTASHNPFYQQALPHQSLLSLVSDPDKSKRIQQTFDEFNESWLVYWDAYIDLQNQLYESLKAARDVTWLGATDSSKLRLIPAIAPCSIEATTCRSGRLGSDFGSSVF